MPIPEMINLYYGMAEYTMIMTPIIAEGHLSVQSTPCVTTWNDNLVDAFIKLSTMVVKCAWIAVYIVLNIFTIYYKWVWLCPASYAAIAF